MWTPGDPDEPTSDLYRLMPARRSELREALDAVAGRGQQDELADSEADAPGVILAGQSAVSRRARHRRAWISGAMQNAVGGIITAAIVAIAAYLAAHYIHHPGAPGSPRAVARNGNGSLGPDSGHPTGRSTPPRRAAPVRRGRHGLEDPQRRPAHAAAQVT
jgi:hypothetical protein